MYGFVRLILGCVFLISAIIIIRRSTSTCTRRQYICAVICTIVLVTFASFFPVENVFFTFDSAESVYEYVNFSSSSVNVVVSGKNCDFVVGKNKNNVNKYLTVPKTSDGWKIGIGTDLKLVTQKIDIGIFIYIYQYKDTSDYFVTILDMTGNIEEITDSLNTDFISSTTDNNSTDNIVAYYANIQNIDNKYWLCLDDNIVSVFEN